MYIQFNDFATIIIEGLNKRLEGSNIQPRIEEVKQPNASYIGLLLGKTGLDLTPCVNLEKAYAFVRANNFNEDAVKEVVNTFASALENIPPLDLEWIYDYDKAKTRLFTRVYNTGCEGLMYYPYTTVHDLAVTYAVKIEIEDNMIGAAPVTWDLLSAWGKKLPDLVRDAKESQEKVMPSIFVNMAEFLPFPSSERQPLFILTNEKMVYGASALFYPGMMEKIAKMLGGDYFVIPSSIHETLILPVGIGVEADDLESAIRSVNGECLAPEEQLSEHAYLYDTTMNALVVV